MSTRISKVKAAPPQEAWCVWLTGLPGSGKSSVARAMARRLKRAGIPVRVVSSDAIRRSMTPRPGYNERERSLVYSAVAAEAKSLAMAGANVIIDATANRRRYRERARRRIKRFFEAHLRCPLTVCLQRESLRKRAFLAPKGIYKKAKTGRSRTVPGMGAPYERPRHPDVVVDTSRLTPDECAKRVLKACRLAPL